MLSLPISYKSLPWDAEHLNMSCGLIDCSDVSSSIDAAAITQAVETILSANQDIQFITIKIPSHLTDVLNSIVSRGGVFIDTELIYRHNPKKKAPFMSSIKFYTLYEEPAFLSLAAEMKWSRFFLDHRIPDSRALNLWQTSIDNHLKGRAADLAIAFRSGKPVGVVIIHKAAGTVNLFLVGVLPHFQKMGVGTELLNAVTDKYRDTAEMVVETSIQNRGAQKLYERCGFQLSQSRYLLHYIQS